MKLYPKKLRTIEDLEREKRLVLKEKRKLDKEDIFSVKGIMGKGSRSKRDDDDDERGGLNLESILDMLPIKSPLVSMGIKMAMRVFTRKSDDKKDKYERSSKKKPSRVKALAFEVLGGYLKWKAIQLTYKGARSIIKKRREKNANKVIAVIRK